MVELFSCVQKASLIFHAPLDTDHRALGRLHGDDDGPATDAAIFDVFLTPDRAVNENLDLLTAIRTPEEC